MLKRHVESSSKIPFISESAQKVLTNYRWPGNVRELENVLQRAIVLCEDNIIDQKDIMIDSSISEKLYADQDLNNSNRTAIQA